MADPTAAGRMDPTVQHAGLTEAVAASASPHRQVRAFAYLLGERRLAAQTCSRLAARAAQCGSRDIAVGYLRRRGLDEHTAAVTVDFLWGEPRGAR
jgi:hypothetical protein